MHLHDQISGWAGFATVLSAKYGSFWLTVLLIDVKFNHFLYK